MHFASSELIDLDLITVLTAGLFLLHGTTAAGTFAFGQGLAIDLFSGGMSGLFAVMHLCVFAGILAASRYVDLHTRKGQMLLVSFAFLLKKILFLALLKGIDPHVSLGVAFLGVSVVSLVLTGLAAPPVIASLAWVKHTICVEDRDAGSGDN